VRGTKNPDLDAIRQLRPDVVIANHEENRELDVRRLRESGVEVHVTRIETVPEAVETYEHLFDEVLGWERPAWLAEVRELWCGPLPDVRARENYIACNVWTRSELVVLIRRGSMILGQIDVDSDAPDPFTPEEQSAVKQVADALAVLL
jgi:hypothetical protein